MVRKKMGSTTMESQFDELEHRMQEMDARIKKRFNEQNTRFDKQSTRMDQILAMLQKHATTVEPKQKEKPSGSGGYGEGERRLRKIDLPVFNGEDAPGWLTKIERFFRVRRIEEDEKLDAAMMAVEGEALSWLQWWESSSEVQTWDDLKEALLRRFQPTVITNAFEMLMSMKQEGTVREYRKKFESVSSHIKVQDQDLFVG